MASKKEIIEENEVLRDKLTEMDRTINEILSILKVATMTEQCRQFDEAAMPPPKAA